MLRTVYSHFQFDNFTAYGCFQRPVLQFLQVEDRFETDTYECIDNRV